jgi:hypothetical protein
VPEYVDRFSDEGGRVRDVLLLQSPSGCNGSCSCVEFKGAYTSATVWRNDEEKKYSGESSLVTDLSNTRF